MRLKIAGKNPFKRMLCVFLVITVLSSVSLAAVVAGMYANEASVDGIGSSGIPFSEVFDMQSDPDSSNAVFLNMPIDNGRIWTDKSVNRDRAFIYDMAGKPIDSVVANPDEFLVTFSALSQSFTTDAIVEPSDTVFVIDVSGSMYTNTVPGSGTPARTRIAVMVDALNLAIQDLMDANPDNRISVVAYGGQSVSGQNQARVNRILRLDRYNVSDGRYFSMVGTNQITVSSQIPNSALYDGLRTVNVDGGTPTQLGIFYGAGILLERQQVIGDILHHVTDSNGDLMYEDGVPVTVIRRPNIILMTDGEPTMGWTDYSFSNPASVAGYGYDIGNAATADMGLSLVTVLTASYMKQQVRQHYYGDSVDRSVGFYTIGLGVNTALVRAAMDPYGDDAGDGIANAGKVSQVLSGTTYNMLDLLNNFTAGGQTTITFPALTKGSSTQRTLRTVTNPGGFVRTADYANLSFSAMNLDDLKQAFDNIAQAIITQGSYSTGIPAGSPPQFDGYLVLSDVLGEYMEFRGFEGLWHEGNRVTGATLARDVAGPAPVATIRANYINTITQHISYGDGSLPQTIAAELVDSNIAAGHLFFNSLTDFNNSVKYYTDENRDFLGSYFTAAGSPAARPVGATAIVELFTVQGSAHDPVTGETVDLMTIAFHVVTALETGGFKEIFSDGTQLVRNLQAGDQIVRWYIPASLIPLRTVTSVLAEDGTVTNQVQIVEAIPIRTMYSVGLNVDRILSDGISASYMSANGVAGANAYYFYTNQWRDPANVTMTFFEPSDGNPFYQFPEPPTARVKASNSTETAAYIWTRNPPSYDGTGRFVQVYRLGNNGRLMLPFTELTVDKEWSLPLGESDWQNVDWIKPEWIQLYGNGDEVGEPALFDPVAGVIDVNGNLVATIIWENILLYNPIPDQNGNVDFMQYTVLEGTWNGVGTPFIPYGPDNEPVPPFNINYYQPQLIWDSNLETWVWSNAYVTNFEQRDEYQRILIFDKEFIGIDPFAAFILRDASGNIVTDSDGNPILMSEAIQFDIFKGVDGVFPGLDGNPGVPNVTLFYPLNFINGRLMFDVSGDYNSFKIVERVHYNMLLDGGFYDWTLSYNVTEDTGNANFELVREPDPTTGPDFALIITDIDDLTTISVTLTNTYELTTPLEFTLGKLIEGSLDWNDLHDIVFVVEGFSDRYGNRPIFNDRVHINEMTQLFTDNGIISFPRDDQVLQPGWYRITEIGAENSTDADGNVHKLTDVSFHVMGSIHDGFFINPFNNLLDPGELFWLGPEMSDVHFLVTNWYERLPNLIIRKEIEAYTAEGTAIPLGSFNIPNDIVFTIVGPNDFEEQVLFSMFQDGQYVLTGLEPGEYTITETGGNVPGFNGPFVFINDDSTPGPAYTFELTSADLDYEVTFINRYIGMTSPPPARLQLVKLIYGDPSPMPTDIVFEITGPNDFFLEVPFSDFDAQGRYFVEGLAPGIYTVTEVGGNIPGYSMEVNHPDGFTTQPLLPGGQEEVIFTNTYEAVIPPGRIIIEKIFDGLPSDVDPMDLDISFEISGPAEDDDPISITVNLSEFTDVGGGVFRYDGDKLIDLPAGTYVITETGADVPGFVWLNPGPSVVTISDGDVITVTFTNEYTSLNGWLMITKTFSGLPDDFLDFVSDISFTIIGVDDNGDEISRNTLMLRDFVYNDQTSMFESELLNLPAGMYTITENGGFASGYVLLRPMPGVIRVTAGETIEVPFTNDYTPIPSYLLTPGLRVRKVFHGLLPAEYPPNFEIVITGPNGFEESFGLADIMSENGIFIEQLEPGEYSITESGATVPGFDMTVIQDLPIIVYVPEDGVDAEILVVIDNVYTPIPPTSPRGSLTVRKVFEGLTQAQIPQNFQLRVTGPGDFDRTITIAQAIAGITLDNLPIGYYTITESNSEVTGFTMTVSPQLPNTISVTENTNISVIITNTYTQIPPVLPRGSLWLQKVFTGLRPAQIPQNFELVVDGPGDYIRVLNLEEALEGILLEDLPLGYYTIRENNSRVPGFTMTVIPRLPLTFSLTETESHREFTIVNRYRRPSIFIPPPPEPPYPPTEPPYPPTEPPYPPTEPPIEPPGPPTEPPTEPPYPPDVTDPPDTVDPPDIPGTTDPFDPWDPNEPAEPAAPTDPTEPRPPPLAPQTGDERQMGIFIILLIIGIWFMGSAFVYGKRKRLFGNGKN